MKQVVAVLLGTRHARNQRCGFPRDIFCSNNASGVDVGVTLTLLDRLTVHEIQSPTIAIQPTP
jgi:hypothetical protein